MSQVRIGILGTTSWGTTLAIILARQGMDVCLWARTQNEAANLLSNGQNQRFLPDVPFPPNLCISSDNDEAFSDRDLVVVAVPSKSFRDNIKMVSQSLNGSTILVSATKGLESMSGKRMTQILLEELNSEISRDICALSGPNLAKEIIQGEPSSTVVASDSLLTAQKVQSLITSPKFRVYWSTDLAGVEFGGALKNIIGIGAGICDGLGFGDNTKAAFITRGLAEIIRLGVAGGANPSTFSGLSGIGDLIATCSSGLSRNHFVGEQLVIGKSLGQIKSSMDNVAEGIDTTAAAFLLAKRLKVAMPITEAIYHVLFEDMGLDTALERLLERPPSLE